jgi:hypothetical protein
MHTNVGIIAIDVLNIGFIIPCSYKRSDALCGSDVPDLDPPLSNLPPDSIDAYFIHSETLSKRPKQYHNIYTPVLRINQSKIRNVDSSISPTEFAVSPAYVHPMNPISIASFIPMTTSPFAIVRDLRAHVIVSKLISQREPTIQQKERDLR